ncbi:hypothetical protein GBS0709_12680 [Edwardsiella tarda]|nr:hypothetical protein GBS0709_12680 [Edwardsiella tarda]
MREWSGSCPHPLSSAKSTLYVIHQPSGHKYTRDGFNRRWRQAKKTAKERYPELDVNFTFHDLNAKGIADLKGNIDEKQAISSHKNVEQTARYNRKIPIVPTVDGQ